MFCRFTLFVHCAVSEETEALHQFKARTAIKLKWLDISAV